MRYTERIVGTDVENEYGVLAEMEEKYEEKDTSFFNEVLKREPSLVVRVHAVTVLSEIGDESSVPVLADVMKNDPSPLIRHECSFSLGQMGLKSAVPYLCESALHDPSEIVRHESAAAPGSIGDESARDALVKASEDPSDEVRGSAVASLFNLDFLKQVSGKRQHVRIVNEPEQRKKRKMPHP
ncbi:MAG: HEAT repeat domain-containing protein [Nitrososphaerota archaeon]|nr:HEAT repeat domain-containing protein [Nitrososphaerota archaeon]